MDFNENQNSFDSVSADAAKYIAGGVVSLNRKVSPNIIFQKGIGSKIYDITGKSYIDYHAGFAPFLLGHNFEQVNKEVFKVISDGWSLIGSGTNRLEAELAKELCEILPSLEKVQITNTGSEATAHAIRLSRAYTGREDIILTLGGYNGWHNEVSRAVMPSLAQIGERVSPGEYPFVPSSAGIPEGTKRKIHIVNYNDLESVAYIMKRYPVACVLTEPVLQNIGVVLPKPGYLKGLIDLCEENGSVCIFDEVKTGFRSGLGGFQGIEGVKPHLSVFGKAVANGYPLGVIGGRKDIMDLFDSPDPAKRVLIAGTYNAHPVNAAAAIATLKILKNPGIYLHLQKMSELLYSGLKAIFEENNVPVIINNNASAFCVYFCDKKPNDLHDVLKDHNFDYDLKYRKALIDQGIYHIPIACKQGSISYSHSVDDITKTLELTAKVVKSLRY